MLTTLIDTEVEAPGIKFDIVGNVDASDITCVTAEVKGPKGRGRPQWWPLLLP